MTVAVVLGDDGQPAGAYGPYPSVMYAQTAMTLAGIDRWRPVPWALTPPPAVRNRLAGF